MLRVCVEYIYWEAEGNTALTCTFLTTKLQILTSWAWTYTRKILPEKKKLYLTLRILMPSLLNVLLIRVS